MLLAAHHIAANVSDLDGSIAFYEALGFEVLDIFELDGGSRTLAQLRLGEQILELASYAGGVEGAPAGIGERVLGLSHIGLVTEDIRATLQDLKAAGLASLDVEVRATPLGMQIAFFTDPDGIAIELLQMAAAEPEG